MPELETLAKEVLKQRHDIDRDSLLRMIDDKKRRVGAGYLTDQGALFLVASDLEVSLDVATNSNKTLKDLHIGLSNVSVIGRVMTIYTLKEYSRRDGSKGAYRRLVIYDKNSVMKVNLWDEKASTVDILKIVPDKVIRIVKGYIKANLNNEPVLYVGDRGKIEVVDDKTITDEIPRLKDTVKNIANIKTPQLHICVEGTVRSLPKISNFTRKYGGNGRVCHFYFSNDLGTRVRIVLWNNYSENISQLQIKSNVRLVNIRSKIFPHGVELHGDEGTEVYLLTSVSTEK